MQRRRDGEYRLREYDPDTIHRHAVELLTAFAKDPQAAQIADLDMYLPRISDLARDDRDRDDLIDAIYEACGRAVITIPKDAPEVGGIEWATRSTRDESTYPSKAAAMRAVADRDGRPATDNDVVWRRVGQWQVGDTNPEEG